MAIEINDKTTPLTTEFSDVRVGEYFKYAGRIYARINDAEYERLTDEDGEELEEDPIDNVFCLLGHTDCLESDTIVTLVDIEVNVKPIY